MVNFYLGGPTLTEQNILSTILITGSNRGLGFEFARQYAAKGWKVIATARKPDTADGLKSLAKQYPNVILETLDVTDRGTINTLAEKYKGVAIDVLLNNAGIVGAPTPDQTFGSLDFELFDPFFHTNSMGPLMMSQAFLDHLRAGRQKTIAVLSARAGAFSSSLSGGTPPGIYFYRGSKAALNRFMAQLAKDVEEDGIKVAILTPGIVLSEGDQGRSFPGLVDIEESISGMINMIDNLTPEQSGKVFRWDGQEQGF